MNHLYLPSINISSSRSPSPSLALFFNPQHLKIETLIVSHSVLLFTKSATVGTHDGCETNRNFYKCRVAGLDRGRVLTWEERSVQHGLTLGVHEWMILVWG